MVQQQQFCSSKSTPVPAAHTRYNAQKPKISLRWQPLDPKYIGALTLRGSYTEAFHAPALTEFRLRARSSSRSSRFCSLAPHRGTDRGTRYRKSFLETGRGLRWSYGVIYSPKWLKGLTLSADWWHIDLRLIMTTLGADFVISHNPPTPGVVQNGPLVFRAPSPVPGEPVGPVTLVIDSDQNLSGAIFEGLDYEAI